MRLFNILFILSLFGFNSVISSQTPCSYKPLKFKETTPIWRHVVIDSSLIGFQTTNIFNQVFTYTGHNHLDIDFDNSFLHDGFLYSIADSRVGGDYSGVLAEKIDLESGVLVWQITHDTRTEIFREKVIDVTVDQNQFVMKGIRESIDDRDTMDSKAFLGKQFGKTFERRYDLENGNLLSYITPSQDDSLAIDVSFAPNLYYNSFEEKLENYLDARDFSVDKGYYLIKRIINSNGHLEVTPDTIVKGRFSDKPLAESFYANGPRFAKLDNGHFLYIEQYTPLVQYNHSFEAFITEYDQNLNKVKELDLKSLGLDTFSNIFISKVTQDYILLHGFYDQIPPISYSERKSFYLVLDRSFNLVRRFDGKKPNGDNLNLTNKNFASQGIDHFNFIISENANGQSKILLASDNIEGLLEPFKELNVLEENWRVLPLYFLILENGDFLFNFRHFCDSQGLPLSSPEYKEWMRFSKSDIRTSLNEIAINTNNINLYPNPSGFEIILESDQFLRGSILIYDIYGKLVREIIQINGESVTIDIEDLSIGSYFVLYIDEEGSIQNSHFVKF